MKRTEASNVEGGEDQRPTKTSCNEVLPSRAEMIGNSRKESGANERTGKGEPPEFVQRLNESKNESKNEDW